MNILLVNNDVVVSKLVKLSTQKIGDSLDIATSIDEIRGENYDLLILDGALFSRDFLEHLNDKVIYSHSIYITTRESEGNDLFEKQLYKPFLPTELLVMLLKVAAQVKKEQDELSSEIVSDDFHNPFLLEEEVDVSGNDSEEEMFEPEPKFEKSSKAVIVDMLPEERALEVKPILDDEIMISKDAVQIALERVQQFDETVLENISSDEQEFEIKSLLDDDVSDEDTVVEDAPEDVQQFDETVEEEALADEQEFEVKPLLDDEIVSGEDEVEQDALERVHQFEKIEEESLQEIAADEASEEEILDNIFSEEDVSEVKAILDVLSEAPEKDEELVEEVIKESEPPKDIDQELEAALRNISVEELEQGVDEELLMQFDDPTEDLSWSEPQQTSLSNKQNQESIDTLRTLLQALENPKLAKSFRGTITINLTFGEDNES